jgi:DNA-binding CsgD family transcriptional regulator
MNKQTNDRMHADIRDSAYDDKEDNLDIARDVCRILREAGYEVTLPGEQPTMSPKLTARENNILATVADGLSEKETAYTLDISVATVKGHRASIRRKLDLHSTPDLVRYALQVGLVRL